VEREKEEKIKREWKRRREIVRGMVGVG